MIDTIVQGDCKDVLKTIESDSVDLIVTDPPYGYSFMGKDWDKAVIGVDIWSECLRVLKAGAFAFIMSSPRQDVLSRMIVNLEDAGFVVGFTSIYWCYASGFPKASNISKMVDKRLGAEREVSRTIKISKGAFAADYRLHDGRNPEILKAYSKDTLDLTIPSTDEAKALDGSYAGFQPKPSLEVVLVVMKPCSEKTYIDQALANGHGVTWLDDGRIPFVDDNDKDNACSLRPNFRSHNENRITFDSLNGKGNETRGNPQGRFPANLLCSDDVLNDGVDRKSGGNPICNRTHNKGFLQGADDIHNNIFDSDSGSFSRFFSLDSWWDNRIKQLPESVQKTFPFIIVPKASKSEKNKGCEELESKDGGHFAQDEWSRNNMGNTPDSKREKIKNHHPTVKPIKLFSYLITLGSREGDLILDPFVGSGTSCVSAKALDRHYIGIDREAEYITIAESRIKAEQVQPELQLAGG